MTDSILAQIHRQHMRLTSNSQMYAEPQAPAARPQIYVQNDYDISQYQSKPAPSVTDRKPGESDYAYEARISIWSRHIQSEADQIDARARAEKTALDVMHGRGLDGTHGMFSADERQAYRDYAVGTRADGQPIVRTGGLEASVAPAPARIYVSQLQDRPVVRPAIPTGSSGDGWTTR